ncbi:MAG: DUF6442 family protein [Eubacteriales bacterium]|nr:DUF6442 family protein [Eubacteriales bacterium]
MKKEDILAKSRAEKQDEGVEYAANKGRNYGVKALCATFVVLVLLNSYLGQSNDSIFTMFWMYCGFESVGKYRASGNKVWLVIGIMGIICAILFCITHIIAVL